LRNERKKSTQANMGESQSNKHSSGGQKQTFNKKLLDDARAGGTQRRAYCHLAHAAGSADEQEVGDVGARDQKKKAD
jgi:hypothetical protein